MFSDVSRVFSDVLSRGNVADGLSNMQQQTAIVVYCLFFLMIGVIIRSSISKDTIIIPNIAAAIMLIKPTANTNGNLISLFISSFSFSYPKLTWLLFIYHLRGRLS